jgi:hypothetical protein
VGAPVCPTGVGTDVLAGDTDVGAAVCPTGVGAPVCPIGVGAPVCPTGVGTDVLAGDTDVGAAVCPTGVGAGLAPRRSSTNIFPVELDPRPNLIEIRLSLAPSLSETSE